MKPRDPSLGPDQTADALPHQLRIASGFPNARRLPGELPIHHQVVKPVQWRDAALGIARDAASVISDAAPARLIALWGSSDTRSHPLASAVFGLPDGLLWLDLPITDPDAGYPSVSDIFHFAGRMQRAVFDLIGVRAMGASDERRWLHHERNADNPSAEGYPFVKVEGAGVHEIAVGPVHAGIIEPGHFRFQVSGEKVLRLEERLGYTHKGIDARYTRLEPIEASRLAGRVSGDSTVAHAWAYCMALESAAGIDPPDRAIWLRAFLLERERVANHLGDLGAIINDAGLAFGLTQFSRLREVWLRESQALCGHRLMMDQVIPGGVAFDVDTTSLASAGKAAGALAAQVQLLRAIIDRHAGLQDRLRSTGTVTTALARRLGLTGMAGRSSGIACDLRYHLPSRPWAALSVQSACQSAGDVAARVTVRFDELLESLRLLECIAVRVPAGPHHLPVKLPQGRHCGAGAVEGWRGEVFVGLEIEVDGTQQRLVRCHSHDPSWQNWPVLEHAIIGNIVPDFPLINKSFNLSYAGHDL